MWLYILNSFVQSQVNAANVNEINFKCKKRPLCDTSSHSKQQRLSSVREPPSEGELKTFFEKISKAEAKPAILKVTMPYAEEFVPMLSKSQFPLPITELYNPKMLGSDYIELLSECEKVFQDLKVLGVYFFHSRSIYTPTIDYRR